MYRNQTLLSSSESKSRSEADSMVSVEPFILGSIERMRLI